MTQVKGLNETLDNATIRKKKASIGIESNSKQKVTSQLQGDTLIEQATDAEFSSPKSINAAKQVTQEYSRAQLTPVETGEKLIHEAPVR